MSQPLPKALLVDLDDTIVAFAGGADPCWRRLCQDFAPRVPGLSPEELFEAIKDSRIFYWGDAERHRWGRLHPDQALGQIVAGALERLGLERPDLVTEMAATYTWVREETIHLLPGAVEALQWLRERGVRLALVTNGSARAQRRKIDRFGLAPLFDCILIEGEWGSGKPAARIYLQALAQLGARPEEAWMVGDNLEWDVVAPQRLGIRAIWLDTLGQGLPPDSPACPDRIIRSLAELAES